MSGSEPASTLASAKRASNSMRAFLENLTGRSKGSVDWLSADEITVFVGRHGELLLGDSQSPQEGAAEVATLRWTGESYTK